jgi:hypothetical protein
MDHSESSRYLKGRFNFLREANSGTLATLVEGIVGQLRLPLDQVFGETGKVVGGEFLLKDVLVWREVPDRKRPYEIVAWNGFRGCDIELSFSQAP